MHMGHYLFLIVLVLVAYWLGQAQPNLLMGYPNKLFTG